MHSFTCSIGILSTFVYGTVGTVDALDGRGTFCSEQERPMIVTSRWVEFENASVALFLGLLKITTLVRLGLKGKELKVTGMQRTGARAIRTQMPPSKPKNTNSQNTKRTYGQPSELKFLENLERGLR